jgi:hypothetical protein
VIFNIEGKKAWEFQFTGASTASTQVLVEAPEPTAPKPFRYDDEEDDERVDVECAQSWAAGASTPCDGVNSGFHIVRGSTI